MKASDYIHVHIKGFEVNYTFLCGKSKGSLVEFDTIATRNEYNLFAVGKEATCINASVIGDDFTLDWRHIELVEFRECTEKESKHFNKVLSDNNMAYTEYEREVLYPFRRKETFFKLLWIDKGLFPIVINGKRVLLKDFNPSAYDGKYVLVGGDNGYSHCWSGSMKFEDVVKVIGTIFKKSDSNATNAIFGDSRVMHGERGGLRFGEHGDLVIRVVDEPAERKSIVSFS